MTTLETAVNVINWLQVLAVPSVYRDLGRIPSRELLLRQVDLYLKYVRDGERLTDPTFVDPPYQEREHRALHLRTLLERWTPPELTEDIVDAVRGLLYAEGFHPPAGWDAIPKPDEPMTESLIWS